MTTRSRYGTLTTALQSQLNADLQSGTPIPYTRVPGFTKDGKPLRRYYNPQTGIEVSEHYYLNYRRSLSQIERTNLTLQVRTNRLGVKNYRDSLWNSYVLRKQAEQQNKGPLADPSTIIEPDNEEFSMLYLSLIQQRYKVNQMFGEEKVTMNDPGGNLAATLTLLGRRLSTDTQFVGQSDPDWISTHVIPSYSQGAL